MLKHLFRPIAILVTTILWYAPSFSQDTLSFDFAFEVHKLYPSFPIDKIKIEEAKTLLDLNKHYKADWVKEYVSVEITTLLNGENVVSKSKSDILTEEQTLNLIAADIGEDIDIKVKYLPQNSLPYDDVKEINFTLTAMPELDAAFVNGETELMKHLKENGIDQIDQSVFKKYQMAAITFIIDENGQVTNEHIHTSSSNEEIDAILLKAICNMPKWEAATYGNGMKTQQEFVLIVGDTQSCNMYQLNLGRL